MARDHAKLLVRIWGEPDWRARNLGEQHLYELLISQESLNLAGVLPLQPRKWASCTAGVTADDVLAALRGLARSRYVVVDEDTEEVLVRTFIRNDEGFRIPGVLKAALAAAEAAQSPRIRATLAEELGRLPALVGKMAAEMTARVAATRHLLHTTAQPFPEPSAEPIGEPIGEPIHDADRNPSGNPSDNGRKEPIHEPSPEPSAEPSVSVSGSVSEVEVVTSGGGVQEADARASTVPDTATAPREAPDPEADERAYADFVAAARERTTPPPAPIEGAMPPARCRNHLELADPPPCGRCKEAREAQQAWITDRDRKVTAARTAAQAEIAEQRRLERAAIDRCGRCDDRGILPSAVACTHDDRSDPDALPPGRAAFLAARAELNARATAKTNTRPDAPAATGEQLRLIAIRFGEAGVNDRDKRLQVIGDVVGRPIDTTRELTRAEATVILDRFDHPVTDDEPPPAEDEDDVVEAEIVQAPDEFAYSPQMLEDDADAIEAAVLAARDEQLDDDGGEAEQYELDQATWTDPEPGYVYAGGGDESDPPF